MAKNQQSFSNAQIITFVSVIFGLVMAFCGFFTWLFFMHSKVAEPGHELVVIDKPYFFGHEGVRTETVKEGRVLLFNTSTVIPVRKTPSSVSVIVDDFSSADNILLDFETAIQFRIKDSVVLVKEFGAENWFENNIKRQYLSIVREAVKKRTMTQMMSDVQATKDMDDEITKGLQDLVKQTKLPIEILGVSLGRAKPNQSVLNQMNETAAQQQREKTLVASTRAENQREQEQIAKAKADNAYRNAMQLTPEMFIQLEQIKRYSDACAKSSHCIVSSGQSVVQVAR
jgi:regulator of protease activity HflC (stomatin/prohibitin superfamily)